MIHPDFAEPVNLVVFAARESPLELANTISAAVCGCPPGSVVDVIINGNDRLIDSKIVPQNLSVESVVGLNVWFIPFGDKANAWNQHVHAIWHGDLDSVYIDGYVKLFPDSVACLRSTLSLCPDALGSSGVPTLGASASKIRSEMQINGGFHGNLCIIRSSALEQIRQRNIRIPLGLYRVDSLMGSILSFGLSDSDRDWNPKKYVPVSFSATWDCKESMWYSLSDVKAWLRRWRRQQRGKIETGVLKKLLVVDQVRFDQLPQSIVDISRIWQDVPDTSWKALKYWFGGRYLARFAAPLPTHLKPVCVFDSRSGKWRGI